MYDKINPYAPPVDNNPGTYDHSLIKRILLVSSLIAIWFLLMFLVSIWPHYWRVTFRPDLTTWDIIKAFFLDWKSLR